MRHRNHLLAVGVMAPVIALVVAAATVTAQRAAAAPAQFTTTSDAAQAAASWAATQLVGADHLPSPTGDHFEQALSGSFYPNQGENGDLIFGLAAAKVGGDQLTTALTYLQRNVDAYADVSGTQGGPYDGSLGKLAVAAQVAGASATSFGGYNLLAQLKKDECAAATDDGVCSGPGSARNIYSSVSESFVLIAEARAGGADAPSAAALDYFATLQCPSGGFTSDVTTCAAGNEDPDATAYAIMALQAVGGQARELGKAVTWLSAQQNAAGYWVNQSVPNVDTTGLAAAALQGQGVDESKARQWLVAQQVPAGQPGAGALKYGGTFQPSSTKIGASPSVLATAQGVTGMVGGGSLATLTAAGVAAAPALLAPTATLSPSTSNGAKSVTGYGFAAGEQVGLTLHSTPVDLGTATVNPSGVATVSFTVPNSEAAGEHSLVLTGYSSGLSVTIPVRIAAAPASSVTSSSGASSSTGGASGAPTAGGATSPGTPAASDARVIATANTGQDGRRLVTLTFAGLLAVVLGGIMLAFARRRYVGTHTRR